MKLPQRRIQWICLAIAAYFAWGIYDTLYTYGLSQPKALAGSVIGTLAFGLFGIISPPPKKEPIQAAETTRGK